MPLTTQCDAVTARVSLGNWRTCLFPPPFSFLLSCPSPTFFKSSSPCSPPLWYTSQTWSKESWEGGGVTLNPNGLFFKSGSVSDQACDAG